MIKKLIIIWAVLCFGSVVMVILAKPVYGLWVGKSIEIPFSLTVSMAFYVCVFNWNNIFAQFNNGLSKIYIQFWFALIAGIVFIPLAVITSKKIGLAGILLAMVLSILPSSFIAPLQSSKLIHGKAKGIWNK